MSPHPRWILATPTREPLMRCFHQLRSSASYSSIHAALHGEKISGAFIDQSTGELPTLAYLYSAEMAVVTAGRLGRRPIAVKQRDVNPLIQIAFPKVAVIRPVEEAGCKDHGAISAM